MPINLSGEGGLMPTATGPTMDAIEQVLIAGDLEQLSAGQRLSYYNRVCQSLGLNPLTQPFEYIRLNNKLRLYAKRDATDQLRKRDGISVTITARELIEGVYVVTARATTPDGRADESTGAVPIEGLKGEFRANSMMKCETKAKRRVTLSICGLGLLDETEVEPAIDMPAPPALPPPTDMPPTNIDTISLVAEQRAAGKAFWVITLTNGFIAVTRDAALADAADQLRRDRKRVELVYTAQKDAKLKPLLQQIVVVADEVPESEQ
jgi:hypothetical protein